MTIKKNIIPQDLIKGIYPNALTIWVCIFYMSLTIIRPWEKLLVWMRYYPVQKVTAIVLLSLTIISSKASFKITKQGIIILIFVFALFFTSLFGYQIESAWGDTYDYLTVVFLFFIFLAVTRSTYDLAFIIIGYIVIMEVYLAKSLWEYFVHGHRVYDMGVVRMIGIDRLYGSPNGLAATVVHSLPVTMLLWNCRKWITRQWPMMQKKIFPVFLITYFCMAVTTIILTNSRSGFVLMAVFSLMIAAKSLKKKIVTIIKTAAVLSVIGLVVWNYVPEDNKARLHTLISPEEGREDAHRSARGRIEGLKTGLEIFSRKPLTGVGLGGFIPYRVDYIDGVPLKAHSLYGQVLASTGLLGTIPFFLLVLTIFKNSRNIKNALKDSKDHEEVLFLTNLATACFQTTLLLLLQGNAGHNLLRYNWIWMAAFADMGLNFARALMQQKEVKSA
jgi:O-antigen ligase